VLTHTNSRCDTSTAKLQCGSWCYKHGRWLNELRPQTTICRTRRLDPGRPAVLSQFDST
jgi:hypothetical protein